MENTKFSRLSARYLAALRIHFAQGAQMDLLAAHKLGTRAVALGLETLDLARMHDQALAALLLPEPSSGAQYDMATRAAIFFTEAIEPIEKTHRLALKAGADLEKLQATLTRHTRDLANSNRKLQEETAQREAAARALKASRAESTQLIQESHRLLKHSRDVARRILNAREDERRAMSLHLQEEIAQALLGIQIRLITLGKEVSDNDEDFKKEIAITQRLVETSVTAIQRFASELSMPHEN